MRFQKIALKCCAIFCLFVSVVAKPQGYPEYDNEISQDFQNPAAHHNNKNYDEHLEISTPITNYQTTPTSVPDTTTEYKLQAVANAYTSKMPRRGSVRHVAGTIYYTIHSGESSHEQLKRVVMEKIINPQTKHTVANLDYVI
ncbi:uncharacterized protein LOC129743715 isoform X1 [Uranotaenia lowii]|uniref:uncharacterized protein LOC129743715 isoform X1 n=1 Tax=Uranotaenia lowii TaxID=190385 RepID=UPI00247AC17F|nr:uncharacterized protein LOC129743715 isoform X1 [Uranotaenia lowii]